MADSKTRKRARFALRDLEAGKLQAVAGFLAQLSEQPEPVIDAAHREEVQGLRANVQRLERELAAARAALATAPVVVDLIPCHGPPIAGRIVRPQPKPRRRIIDPDAIRDYVRTHPDCEVLGCRKPPCPEPHHLISRKNHRKGDDVPSNLIRLCKPMHELYHANGPRLWLATFGHHLTADTRSKVERAARVSLEEDAA